MSNEMSKEDFDDITKIRDVITPHLRRVITDALTEAHVGLREMYMQPPMTENLPINRETTEQIFWCNVYAHALVANPSSGHTYFGSVADQALFKFNERFPK